MKNQMYSVVVLVVVFFGITGIQLTKAETQLEISCSVVGEARIHDSQNFASIVVDITSGEEGFQQFEFNATTSPQLLLQVLFQNNQRRVEASALGPGVTPGMYPVMVTIGGSYGVGGQTDTCTVLVPVVTDPGGGIPTPTPIETTPEAEPLFCFPDGQTVEVNQPAFLHATGGTAPYSWIAPDSNRFQGFEPDFSTSYARPGIKNVFLSDNNGSLTFCTVNVRPVSTPSPSVSITPSPSVSITPSPSVLVTPTPSNNPPSVISVRVTEHDYCKSGPAAIINWTFFDPNGNPQSAYQVQVDDQGSFSSPIVDSGKVVNSGISYFTGNGIPPWAWATTYKARVRVWDSNDTVSVWKQSGSWTTPRHAYPKVAFSWTPSNPLIWQPVKFTDLTLFSDGGGIGLPRIWQWSFGDGRTSSIQNPTHTFEASGTYNVVETVSDRDGYICSTSSLFSVQRTAPVWKEVAPVD